MPQYFPGKLEESLDRNQEKAVTDHRIYTPVFDYLNDQEVEFQTEDLVDSANPGSKLDDYRAGFLLGALRDEFELIDGSLENGNYRWDPELEAEGDWIDVKKELDRLNKPKTSKV